MSRTVALILAALLSLVATSAFAQNADTTTPTLADLVVEEVDMHNATLASLNAAMTAAAGHRWVHIQAQKQVYADIQYEKAAHREQIAWIRSLAVEAGVPWSGVQAAAASILNAP